jgi:hypothetical protein
VAAAAVAATLAASAPPAAAAAKPYDFDGDGRQELALPVPGWADEGRENAGAVLVQRTNRRGLGPSAQLIARSTPGFPGDPEAGLYFGADIASADFNGDGFADLAAIDSAYAEGGTTIVYGSAAGLDPTTATTAPDGENPVYSLAAGDIDGDGYADLALGTWVYGDPPIPDRDERVLVLRGGPSGIGATPGTTHEINGSVMRLADTNGDGRADLVSAGYSSLSVCPGGTGGLGSCATLPANGFPSDLAVGNLSGDAGAEIAVGRPDPVAPGAVQVYRTTASGLRYAFRIDQTTRGVPGNQQEGDEFGAALELGQVGRGRYADLVIGAPGEDDVGRVTVVHGGKRAIARRGNFTIAQHHPGVPGKARRNDRFGGALALLDHNGDRRADLDIGAPGESGFTGRVTALYAHDRSLTTRGARAFGLDTLGFPPLPSAGFGMALGGS